MLVTRSHLGSERLRDVADNLDVAIAALEAALVEMVLQEVLSRQMRIIRIRARSLGAIESIQSI